MSTVSRPGDTALSQLAPGPAVVLLGSRRPGSPPVPIHMGAEQKAAKGLCVRVVCIVVTQGKVSRFHLADKERLSSLFSIRLQAKEWAHFDLE